MTESVVEQSVHCTESVRTLHYSTFIEPQRQKWRSPRQGRQSDERGRDRVSQRLRDWADLETRNWRVSLTQHWLLTHKASTTGRLSVTGQVLPSRLLFIVECLLLSTVLFASLSLSLVCLIVLRRRATIDLECHGANSKARRDALDSPRRCRC